MNLAALAHRPESEDSFLYTDKTLHLRFHTARQDVAKVTVLYGDPYWRIPDAHGADQLVYQRETMTLLGTGQVLDHWVVTLEAPYRRLQYLFEVTGQDGTVWLYGDRGLRKDSADARHEAENYFRMPYFQAIDRVKTPDWVKTTVWYQIFPERFANGDPNNDPDGTKPWHPTDHPGREDFYGGDLQGVLDHLDDLQALGINGLYFCPIFTATSNHKYDTIDYLNVDPAFGDKALLAKLIHAAHQRGMRVMLDAVFNHMGYGSLQWQDVLRNGEKSRFASWFHLHQTPVTPFHNPLKGEGQPQYDTFAFEEKMPKLNTANPEVQDYLLMVATYWIKTFDIDAWRLDVANEVDHHFWKKFYHAVTAIKPDFYVLGEVWHRSQAWLNGDEFSGTMNYPFTQQIEDHFFKRRRTAAELVALLTDQLMLYRDQTNQVMLNMLDSHDTPRILTLAHGDEDLALQALAFTWMQTGSPCLYYGTEMSMSGGADPDNRKPMDWAKLGQPIWKRVAALVHFRRQHATTLGTGTTRLSVTDTGLIKVVRQGNEMLTGYFNTTEQPVAVNREAVFAQGFVNGQLAPKGFMVVAG
ncbi:glycoside hydrolase family 13 protein [Lacticaseibacillus casei]|jgi:glycosidase|uniref:Glycoside hydrolase family 13 protein n=1 Tax=Lacticaseibacillus huelsenbergensis TaxID=3035291 RepID=A0ABY8DRU5_9LACO|nr:MULTISPECIES: glycoside hydrolase family 13 protein [Lacticaseibacillus]MDG3062665.1 glycoside hydrolase family 13 protein [Lacticaseibacillus sp. BCRC 81376]QVI38208.1 alpha-glycosidase [Lacticaseibacillus casei]QXG60022.1 glycoside hydrolase family 13 protein [Lacticaseibacillus casei]WFB38502.1 glycoside hydrolase family 13 protein [Lacticaseibacillus huelsenbergensis]WFB42926.1 glycoside hydrolase family 13 protein [Lacticaseibacillus huelsenbergensis]